MLKKLPARLTVGHIPLEDGIGVRFPGWQQKFVKIKKQNMENEPNIENREAVIDKLIEDLARREEMNPDDILSDIFTFLEISKEDEDAKVYFEELADKIGISVKEIMDYAVKKSEDHV